MREPWQSCGRLVCTVQVALARAASMWEQLTVKDGASVSRQKPKENSKPPSRIYASGTRGANSKES